MQLNCWCNMQASVKGWRKIQTFFYEINSYMLRKDLLSVCSRYFNLSFKSLHNNDISTAARRKSSVYWDGCRNLWQEEILWLGVHLFNSSDRESNGWMTVLLCNQTHIGHMGPTETESEQSHPSDCYLYKEMKTIAVGKTLVFVLHYFLYTRWNPSFFRHTEKAELKAIPLCQASSYVKKSSYSMRSCRTMKMFCFFAVSRMGLASAKSTDFHTTQVVQLKQEGVSTGCSTRKDSVDVKITKGSKCLAPKNCD